VALSNDGRLLPACASITVGLVPFAVLPSAELFWNKCIAAVTLGAVHL